MKRREALASIVAGIAGWRMTISEPVIPLIHITDLYHPPQDPDDHIDLATVAALPEFDIRAVILDPTRKFLVGSPEGDGIRREPGFLPVTTLAKILGKSIPVAAGPSQPLTDPLDDLRGRPDSEQAGVRLLLDALEHSNEKVAVSVVGSARVLTAAFNRRPAFVRSRVRFVMLNAGALSGVKREWNVGLDPEAFIGLWNSGLPIRWYPCATDRSAFDPDHERGTYWKTTHAKIFRDLSRPVREWFTTAFSAGVQGSGGEKKDPAAAWEVILKGERNMWSTASLVSGAGRVLAETPQGWRFVPSRSAPSGRVWHWYLDPITATITRTAEVKWRLSDRGAMATLFRRERGASYAEAMSEALCALLATL